MKTKSLLVALVLSIGLLTVSCSSTDNAGDTIAPIVGKWGIVKIGTNNNGVETLIDAPQNQSGCDHDFINLKIDNTLTSGDYSSTLSPCALSTISGTYSKSGSQLTTVINGATTTYDIVNLTLSELKLKQANGAVSVYIR
ncbi:lipocalin family protein [Flavobacterium sp.]|uniref:lipocalin family protein n=1 Tax=Flavobacterium sp. TaxID=239 RepID=UPI00286DA39F|nr:lipocalin family protein [Flavobacterium sp.]